VDLLWRMLPPWRQAGFAPAQDRAQAARSSGTARWFVSDVAAPMWIRHGSKARDRRH